MYRLNSNELCEIKNICNTWLIHKNNKLNSGKLDIFYQCYKGIDFSSVIKAFSDRLKTINWQFTKSEEVSGSICFFGGVATSVLNYGYIKEIEGLFTFAVCYMLIDHFLDNEAVSDSDKLLFIKEIYQFIITGVKNDNLMVQAVGDRYLELINRVPKCREFFIKLFISELEGYKIEKTNTFTRNDYSKSSDEKGGLTSLCIASIIGLPTDEKNHEVGALIQKVDNLLDIEDDKAAGIYTLARYDLDNGNLDRYLYETMIRIKDLSPIYNVFKIILLLGLILGIHDHPGCISNSLNEIIKNYDIFEGTSKNKLIEWFHSKLGEYMKNNDL